jgi:ParB family transcriptional regulator, chromosome partitioning protein
MADIIMSLSVDDIIIPEGRREAKPAEVKKLADSIKEIGLKHPITVRRGRDNTYILVAGRHRLEAFRKLGEEFIPSLITSMSKAEARKWEISENLHRCDLTKIERAELLSEWITITQEEVSGQVVPKPGTMGGRPESGIAAASRELGIGEKEAQRAVKIAAISAEAKAVARESGLDNNQAILLKIATAAPEQQVATVHKLASDKVTPKSDKEKCQVEFSSILGLWNKIGDDAKRMFLREIGVGNVRLCS